MSSLPFFIWNWISPRVEISCEFTLCFSQKLDGYFRINNEALLVVQVGVNRG